jgi:hypothetical protein
MDFTATRDHSISIGSGKSGKTTASLWDKLHPDSLAAYQEKYKRWDVCRKDCGEHSRDPLWQLLWQIHGDNGFFRWHTEMNQRESAGMSEQACLNLAKQAWTEQIEGERLGGPRYIELDDPNNRFSHWLKAR